MATENTRRRKYYKTRLLEILKESAEAHKVANRYKLMAQVLFREYPGILQSASKDTVYEFLRDVVYVDRAIRLETSGDDEDIKLELGVKVAEDLKTGNY